ncbi:MAG: winged-helix domain-containing protein [Sphaerochaeta sp.]
MNTTNRGIPIPTIKRFPSYLRLLKGYRDEGMQTVSATVLAEELGL